MKLTKMIPCNSCKIPLHPAFLKNGTCNGCRNPHLVVVAVTK